MFKRKLDVDDLKCSDPVNPKILHSSLPKDIHSGNRPTQEEQLNTKSNPSQDVCIANQPTHNQRNEPCQPSVSKLKLTNPSASPFVTSAERPVVEKCDLKSQQTSGKCMRVTSTSNVLDVNKYTSKLNSDINVISADVNKCELISSLTTATTVTENEKSSNKVSFVPLQIPHQLFERRDPEFTLSRYTDGHSRSHRAYSAAISNTDEHKSFDDGTYKQTLTGGSTADYKDLSHSLSCWKCKKEDCSCGLNVPITKTILPDNTRPALADQTRDQANRSNGPKIGVWKATHTTDKPYSSVKIRSSNCTSARPVPWRNKYSKYANPKSVIKKVHAHVTQTIKTEQHCEEITLLKKECDDIYIGSGIEEAGKNTKGWDDQYMDNSGGKADNYISEDGGDQNIDKADNKVDQNLEDCDEQCKQNGSGVFQYKEDWKKQFIDSGFEKQGQNINKAGDQVINNIDVKHIDITNAEYVYNSTIGGCNDNNEDEQISDAKHGKCDQQVVEVTTRDTLGINNDLRNVICNGSLIKEQQDTVFLSDHDMMDRLCESKHDITTEQNRILNDDNNGLRSLQQQCEDKRPSSLVLDGRPSTVVLELSNIKSEPVTSPSLITVAAQSTKPKGCPPKSVAIKRCIKQIQIQRQMKIAMKRASRNVSCRHSPASSMTSKPQSPVLSLMDELVYSDTKPAVSSPSNKMDVVEMVEDSKISIDKTCPIEDIEPMKKSVVNLKDASEEISTKDTEVAQDNSMEVVEILTPSGDGTKSRIDDTAIRSPQGADVCTKDGIPTNAITSHQTDQSPTLEYDFKSEIRDLVAETSKSVSSDNEVQVEDDNTMNNMDPDNYQQKVEKQIFNQSHKDNPVIIDADGAANEQPKICDLMVGEQEVVMLKTSKHPDKQTVASAKVTRNVKTLTKGSTSKLSSFRINRQNKFMSSLKKRRLPFYSRPFKAADRNKSQKKKSSTSNKTQVDTVKQKPDKPAIIDTAEEGTFHQSNHSESLPGVCGGGQTTDNAIYVPHEEIKLGDSRTTMLQVESNLTMNIETPPENVQVANNDIGEQLKKVSSRSNASPAVLMDHNNMLKHCDETALFDNLNSTKKDTIGENELLTGANNRVKRKEQTIQTKSDTQQCDQNNNRESWTDDYEMDVGHEMDSFNTTRADCELEMNSKDDITDQVDLCNEEYFDCQRVRNRKSAKITRKESEKLNCSSNSEVYEDPIIADKACELLREFGFNIQSDDGLDNLPFSEKPVFHDDFPNLDPIAKCIAYVSSMPVDGVPLLPSYSGNEAASHIKTIMTASEHEQKDFSKKTVYDHKHKTSSRRFCERETYKDVNDNDKRIVKPSMKETFSKRYTEQLEGSHVQSGVIEPLHEVVGADYGQLSSSDSGIGSSVLNTASKQQPVARNLAVDRAPSSMISCQVCNRRFKSIADVEKHFIKYHKTKQSTEGLQPREMVPRKLPIEPIKLRISKIEGTKEKSALKQIFWKVERKLDNLKPVENKAAPVERLEKEFNPTEVISDSAKRSEHVLREINAAKPDVDQPSKRDTLNKENHPVKPGLSLKHNDSMTEFEKALLREDEEVGKKKPLKESQKVYQRKKDQPKVKSYQIPNPMKKQHAMRNLCFGKGNQTMNTTYHQESTISEESDYFKKSKMAQKIFKKDQEKKLIQEQNPEGLPDFTLTPSELDHITAMYAANPVIGEKKKKRPLTNGIASEEKYDLLLRDVSPTGSQERLLSEEVTDPLTHRKASEDKLDGSLKDMSLSSLEMSFTEAKDGSPCPRGNTSEMIQDLPSTEQDLTESTILGLMPVSPFNQPDNVPYEQPTKHSAVRLSSFSETFLSSNIYEKKDVKFGKLTINEKSAVPDNVFGEVYDSYMGMDRRIINRSTERPLLQYGCENDNDSIHSGVFSEGVDSEDEELDVGEEGAFMDAIDVNVEHDESEHSAASDTEPSEYIDVACKNETTITKTEVVNQDIRRVASKHESMSKENPIPNSDKYDDKNMSQQIVNTMASPMCDNKKLEDSFRKMFDLGNMNNDGEDELGFDKNNQDYDNIKDDLEDAGNGNGENKRDTEVDIKMNMEKATSDYNDVILTENSTTSENTKIESRGMIPREKSNVENYAIIDGLDTDDNLDFVDDKGDAKHSTSDSGSSSDEAASVTANRKDSHSDSLSVYLTSPIGDPRCSRSDSSSDEMASDAGNSQNNGLSEKSASTRAEYSPSGGDSSSDEIEGDVNLEDEKQLEEEQILDDVLDLCDPYEEDFLDEPLYNWNSDMQSENTQNTQSLALQEVQPAKLVVDMDSVAFTSEKTSTNMPVITGQPPSLLDLNISTPKSLAKSKGTPAPKHTPESPSDSTPVFSGKNMLSVTGLGRWMPPGWCFRKFRNQPCLQIPCGFRHEEPSQAVLLSSNNMAYLSEACTKGEIEKAINMMESHPVYEEHMKPTDLWQLFKCCRIRNYLDMCEKLYALMMKRNCLPSMNNNPGPVQHQNVTAEPCLSSQPQIIIDARKQGELNQSNSINRPLLSYPDDASMKNQSLARVQYQGNPGKGLLELPNDGKGIVNILNSGKGLLKLTNEGKGLLKLPNEGKGLLKLPNEGKGLLKLPNEGKGLLKLPNEGKGLLKLPNEGKGILKLPNEGKGILKHPSEFAMNYPLAQQNKRYPQMELGMQYPINPAKNYLQTEPGKQYPINPAMKYPSNLNMNYPQNEPNLSYPQHEAGMMYPAVSALNYPSDVAMKYPGKASANFPSNENMNYPAESGMKYTGSMNYPDEAPLDGPTYQTQTVGTTQVRGQPYGVTFAPEVEEQNPGRMSRHNSGGDTGNCSYLADLFIEMSSQQSPADLKLLSKFTNTLSKDPNNIGQTWDEFTKHTMAVYEEKSKETAGYKLDMRALNYIAIGLFTLCYNAQNFTQACSVLEVCLRLHLTSFLRARPTADDNLIVQALEACLNAVSPRLAAQIIIETPIQDLPVEVKGSIISQFGPVIQQLCGCDMLSNSYHVLKTAFSLAYQLGRPILDASNMKLDIYMAAADTILACLKSKNVHIPIKIYSLFKENHLPFRIQDDAKRALLNAVCTRRIHPVAKEIFEQMQDTLLFQEQSLDAPRQIVLHRSNTLNEIVMIVKHYLLCLCNKYADLVRDNVVLDNSHLQLTLNFNDNTRFINSRQQLPYISRVPAQVQAIQTCLQQPDSFSPTLSSYVKDGQLVFGPSSLERYLLTLDENGVKQTLDFHTQEAPSRTGRLANKRGRINMKGPV